MTDVHGRDVLYGVIQMTGSQTLDPRPASRVTPLRVAWFLVACLGFLYISARPAAAQDCDSCIDGIRVGVQAALLSSRPADYSSISVYGGDRRLFITGPGCQSTILTNKGYIKMKLDQTYIVESSRFLCLAHVNFDAPTGYELYIKTDPIYGNDPVNGPEEFHPGTTIYRTNQGHTGTGDGAWEIVLREKCFSCGGGPGLAGHRAGHEAHDFDQRLDGHDVGRRPRRPARREVCREHHHP